LEEEVQQVEVLLQEQLEIHLQFHQLQDQAVEVVELD
tara:strand:- start:1395 stop:1505 length:111 start_codon:yes stop_codon:yes gene_type:complete